MAGRRVVITIALILLLLSFISAITTAVPAAPVTVRLTQPDGTAFLARPFGDERYHGMKTLDGHPILRDERSSRWVYAQAGPDGTLRKTELSVGKSTPPGSLRAFIPSTTGEPSPWRARPGRGGRQPPVVGENRVLVILVEFDPEPEASGEPGEQSPVGTTPADWQVKVFGESNSVRDYYREVSYGQLDLVPAEESFEAQNDGIVGWLRLQRLHPGTTADPDEASLRLTKAAIFAADPYVDFASFDADGDGYISTRELHIIIVVAGYEEAYGGSEGACSPSVWAHNWSLEGPEVPVVDGVRVADYIGWGSYIQLGEWHCSNLDNPGHPATIGVLAHELGHDLGIGAPDLYDIDGSSSGIGDWGLMGSGAWNGLSFPGDSPAHMTAWTKWLMGWITPVQVTSELPGEAIPQVEFNRDGVYQLLDNPGGVDWSWNNPGTGEYFLVENRQRVGYDAALPGEGLLIWHIDESQATNANEAHRLVGLEQADGRGDLDCSGCGINDGDGGDPFPGATGNRFFNEGSNPASKLYGGFPSGVAVENIGDPGATMTADLSVEALPNDPPVADAGPDQEVKVGETVQLDGSGSFDPNGDPLSFTWTFIATPAGSRRRVGSGLSGATPSFTADMPGDYVLELRVEDGRGGSATDRVTITAVAEVLFSADFEGDPDGWQVVGWESQWHRADDVTCIAPQPGYSSPTHAWHYGRQEDGRCSYSGGGELISPPIPVNGATRVIVSFNYFLQLADRRDRAMVYLSYDGGRRWRRIWSGRRALQGSWTEAQKTVRLRRGSTEIRLKFSFTTGRRSSGQAAGWFIDDIRVTTAGSPSRRRGPEFTGWSPTLAIQAAPSPARGAVRFTVQALEVEAIQVEVFDLAGRRVFASGFVAGNTLDLEWNLLNSRGQPLANGVYLYVVSVKGYGGSVSKSEVRKLIVLR